MSGLAVQLPPELVEAIAQRAADLVLERQGEMPAAASPFMTILEAAEYMRCRRQRIDDLLSARKLRRYKDGSRTLISRAQLIAYVKEGHR